MEFSLLFAGCLFLFLYLRIFVHAKNNHGFLIIFLSIEYFYFLGLVVYPILLGIGLVGLPPIFNGGQSIESLHWLVPLHLAVYAAGSYIGFFTKGRLKRAFIKRLTTSRSVFATVPIIYLNIFVISALLSAFMYFYLIGFERVLTSAALHRSKQDVYEDVQQVLFLSRFLYFGVFAVCFLPYIFSNKIHSGIYLLCIAAIGVSGYLISAGRFYIAQCIVLPILLYILSRPNETGVMKFVRGKLKPLVYVFVAILAFIVVAWGKEAAYVLPIYLVGQGDFEFKYSSADATMFLNNFSGFVVSIHAGIDNFINHTNAPFDYFLAPFGLIPSQALESLGLPWLSYRLLPVSDQLACVNTYLISGQYGSCTIPPYNIGASAYIFPLLGGALFAFTRFYIYSVVYRSWVILGDKSRRLPFVLFAMYVFDQLGLAIPETASFAIFVILIVVAIGLAIKMARHLKSPVS